MTKEEKLIQINKAIEEYKLNKTSLRQLAKKYGVSSLVLSQYIKKQGIEIIEQPRNKKSNLDQAILELNVLSVDEVSEKYGINKTILEESKIKSKNELKKLQIKLAIEEYINTDGYHRSIGKISDKYGINRKTLTKYLKDKGIEIAKKNDFANCYEEAFDVIDTEEKAYWLGFMYADGYITKNNYTIGLNLAVKDMEHVSKFTNFLKFEGGMNISTSHQFGSKETIAKDGHLIQMCSTVITNKHLWESLNSKGCVPNKSLILKFPDESIFSDKSLIRHFIRGYFDGDGTLGKYQHSNTRTNKEASLMFVGTQGFLTDLQKYIGQGFLMQKKNCGPLTYRLSYSTSKAERVAEYMYKDSTVYLNRKYNIYINDFAS